MPTLRRILKYTPAVVMGLLVVAWVVISALNGKPIVTTKPGDLLIHNDKRERVIAVEVYRERYDVLSEDDPNSPQWKPKPLPANGYSGWN